MQVKAAIRSRTFYIWLLALAAFLLSVTLPISLLKQVPRKASTVGGARVDFGKLPVAFEPNMGQADPPNWQYVPSPRERDYNGLADVDGTGPNDVWAVGGYYNFPGPNPNTSLTTDVPENNPFYVWVMLLTNLGVMSGYQCGAEGEPGDDQNRPYFRPFNNVTRGQASGAPTPAPMVGPVLGYIDWRLSPLK